MTVKLPAKISQAKAIAEVNDLEAVKQARDWQAIAWRLERRNPKRWGRKRLQVIEAPRRRRRTREEVEAEIEQVLRDLEGRDQASDGAAD